MHELSLCRLRTLLPTVVNRTTDVIADAPYKRAHKVKLSLVESWHSEYWLKLHLLYFPKPVIGQQFIDLTGGWQKMQIDQDERNPQAFL